MFDIRNYRHGPEIDRDPGKRAGHAAVQIDWARATIPGRTRSRFQPLQSGTARGQGKALPVVQAVRFCVLGLCSRAVSSISFGERLGARTNLSIPDKVLTM